MTNKLSPLSSTSYSAGDTSRGAILQLLFASTDLSRAHMSRESGLSKATVSSIIAELASSSIVEATGSTHGGIGRRAVTYRLSPHAGFGVGIDLGGTNFRAGLVDFAGAVAAEVSLETPHSTIDDLLTITRRTVDMLVKRAGYSRELLAQVVMGIPGVVDPMVGTVRNAPNIPYLNGISLADLISDHLNVPVLVENDVNVAALGELEQSQCDDFGFIALGTGIGMGLVLDGELRRGHAGAAGEIGYLPIGPNVDSRSEEGHYEHLVGGFSLERTYRERVGVARKLTDIFEQAQAGEAAAEALIKELAHNLALGILAVCSVVDLEEVVLGGGVGSRPDLLALVQAEVNGVMSTPPRLRISSLGSRAGLVGAMSYALSSMRGRVLSQGHLKTSEMAS